MKRISLLSLFIFFASVVQGPLYAQGALPTDFFKAANTYKWFKSTGERVRGMAYNPANNHLYIATRDTLGSNVNGGIIILNGTTGDSIGALNMTGVTGGTFAFNRIGINGDGRIYAANLTTAVTKAAPLKIYTWADETAAPVVAFADSVQGPRLGDAMSVVGAGQETYLYVSGNATPGPVNIFKRSGDTLVHYKTVVPTGWASGVLSIGPTTNGVGSFWINLNAKPAQKYDTLGAVLDTVPTGIASTAGSGAYYFEFGGKKFLAIYSGSATVANPSIVRFVDVGDGGSKGVVVNVTPSMGTNANTNAPLGEVVFNPNDTSVYVLSANNGYGKFSVKLAPPLVTPGARYPFVPMAGQNDTVQFTIMSMKLLSGVKLKYYGYKTSVSDQNGVDSADVALTPVTPRIYQAIVPASVNRDGRRVAFRADVRDTVGVMASLPVPGYFAGMTKLAYQGGPREVDTLGVILHKGYGIRTQAVVIVEDSIFQVANSEIVLQDSLGGVTVFKAGTPFDVKRGNAYVVTGTTDNPTGGGSKFQFVDPGLTFTDLGPAPKPVLPRVVTIKQILQNGELWENSLVEVRNVTKTPGSLAWPALAASQNMTFTDASGDSITMRIDSDTNIDGIPEPTYPITIIGVAGQFDNTSPFTGGYQWLPRDTSDLKPMFIGPPPAMRQIVGVKNSKFTAGISNVGHIGALNAYQDTIGFMFNSINALYEGSLIMGNAKNKVPNAARFQAAPSWNPGFRHRAPIMVNKVGSKIETMTAFDDSSYTSPLGIWVNQMTSLDTAAGKEGYLLMAFDVINTTASAINNFRLGSFFDFDLTAAGDADRGGILKDSSNQIPGVNGGNPFKIHLAYMSNGTTFTGVVPLSQTVFAGGRIASGAAEVYSGKMVDSNKYTYISTFRAANMYGDAGAPDDHSIFSSVGPYNIAANDTATGAFALVVGSSLTDLLNNARAAQKAAVQEYGMTIQILTGVGGQPDLLPTAFALEQNFPNPFNPATTIRFALPNDAGVALKIYDMLGREIRSLVNTKMNAGFHEVQWNGRNNLGSQVASGMYIYRIEAGSFVSTKKMMLLK